MNGKKAKKLRKAVSKRVSRDREPSKWSWAYKRLKEMVK